MDCVVVEDPVRDGLADSPVRVGRGVVICAEVVWKYVLVCVATSDVLWVGEELGVPTLADCEFVCVSVRLSELVVDSV